MKDNIEIWPLRPWILAAFLAIAGFFAYLLVEEKILSSQSQQLRVALLTLVCVTATSFAFSLERVRWLWVVWFSLASGLILGFVAHSSFISHDGRFELNFSLWSGLFAAAVAVPLFQTIIKHGRFKLVYQDLHQNAWSDVLSWCASWVFVGLSFALAHLLASLFDLIGIDLLKELLKETWFAWMFIGANFGAALGVLKENERVAANLQNLVMVILSILTPILCISLVLFLVSLPFTGLQLFWDTTRSTSPILLACAIGAVTLVNAIIRNSEEEESNNRIMRYSAIGLSACILPLALIAVVSMQQRVEQYGLTPDRIWGMVAISVAVAYGIAYLWSLINKRVNWASNIRTNNTRMAILLCIAALFLALPIVNFGKLSVSSQLARINDGRTPVTEIDYTAFAFDFGEHGRQALQKMKNSKQKTMVNGAKIALDADTRWSLKESIRNAKSKSLLLSTLTVFPKSVPLPDGLVKAINQQAGCLGEYCLLIWEPGTEIAQFVTSPCKANRNHYSYQSADDGAYQYCPPQVTHMYVKDNKWQFGIDYSRGNKPSTQGQREAEELAILKAIKRGDIEILTVERKQLMVGGKPVGDVY
jgi:hypothetical protein